ncbi:hypothetical protein U1Q18_042646, partial [Sarracenia purpurea var. burkii]
LNLIRSDTLPRAPMVDLLKATFGYFGNRRFSAVWILVGPPAVSGNIDIRREYFTAALHLGPVDGSWAEVCCLGLGNAPTNERFWPLTFVSLGSGF